MVVCYNELYQRNTQHQSPVDLNFHIQVDGGINQKTAFKAFEAGATSLVAGSFVFKASDMKKAINSLRNKTKKG